VSSTIDSKISQRFFSKPIFFISFSALFVFLFSAIWLNSASSCAFRTDLKHLILSELIDINPLPSGAKVDAIYVLGGSQTGLELKYKTASELYHKGICKRIWILSRPGITEYSVSLGRNLTNEEWSILKLKEFGVPEENVEAIKIKEGFFGTFTEAKGISSLIESRGYRSVLLISSPWHTHRLKISFEKFLRNQHIKMYVQESGGRVLLRQLIIEFIKLKAYQCLLVR
jgi:uncharacterized SAM-binding protein YcdF (DUF218 family)